MNTNIIHYGKIAGAAIAILTVAGILFSLADRSLWHSTGWCIMCFEKTIDGMDFELKIQQAQHFAYQDEIDRQRFVFGWTIEEIIMMSPGGRIANGIPSEIYSVEMQEWFDAKRVENYQKYCKFTHDGCTEE